MGRVKVHAARRVMPQGMRSAVIIAALALAGCEESAAEKALNEYRIAENAVIDPLGKKCAAANKVVAAYAAEGDAEAGQLRAANHYGEQGQRMRRQAFGIMLGMAKVDLKWKRLTRHDQFIFCYERLAGHFWRELLMPCWKEAVLQRRKKGPTQLPLDPRIRDDQSVPNRLEGDPAPRFYPTLADADAFGTPLLGLL